MNTIPALNDTELQALNDALDDEYRAHETYEQVIGDFGPVQPFLNIVEAEARHVSALLSLFEQYGIATPKNRWMGNSPHFASVHEACVESVQGELKNVAIYDRVLKSTRRPDILSVYQALRSASQDRHLPAFQRCAQRGPQSSL
jgi:hypothetical protein